MRTSAVLGASLVMASLMIQIGAFAAGQQGRTITSAYRSSSVAAGTSLVSASSCPGGRNGVGWTLSTSTFDQHYTRHAYVGNGYLSQRVPATGMGYVSTGEKT